MKYKTILSAFPFIMLGIFLFFANSCKKEDDDNDAGPVTPGETEVVDVFNPVTGETWMDRNLGASRAAKSFDDSEAYGVLFQWGRLSDGHQSRTSDTVSVLSNSDTPGHGNFIIISLGDWRSPSNDTLWQGVDGVNNPCPSGYRLPTEKEWEAERQSWSRENVEGAFSSPLKLPAAGNRGSKNGRFGGVGYNGVYWSSTVDTSHYARFILFGPNSAPPIASMWRAQGLSVRCIKN